VSSLPSTGFGVRGRVSPRYPEDATAPGEPAPRRRPWHPWIAGVLLALAAWQVGAAGWIHAKARLAQVLIAHSWQRSLQLQQPVRPWPWADTYPVARLTLARLGIDLYVLAGASGRALAFGPGLVDGTATPGKAGNAVVVGHRDTHFSFLRDVQPGDVLELAAEGGRSARYVVVGSHVTDRDDASVLEPSDDARLTLVTCFPFDAVAAGTRERFVVVAERRDAGRAGKS
jgi:sortase A